MVDSDVSSSDEIQEYNQDDLKPLFYKIHQIMDGRGLHLRETKHIKHLLEILKSGISLNRWVPSEDYHVPESLYRVVVDLITESRKNTTSFAALVIYSLLLHHIQTGPTCQAAQKKIQHVLEYDEQTRRRLSAAHAWLKIQDIMADENLSLTIKQCITSILNLGSPLAREGKMSDVVEASQIAAAKFSDLVKQLMFEHTTGHFIIQLMDAFSHLSRTFCERFLKYVAEEEILSSTLAWYMGSVHDSLYSAVIPKNSIQYHLLQGMRSVLILINVECLRF